MTYAEFKERVGRMTPEQAQRVRDKCQWEHVGWLGVATDWPSLFDVEGMPPATPYRSSQADVVHGGVEEATSQ